MKVPFRPVAGASLVRASCWLALVGLALMAWSVLDPTVWPVMLALSLGQAVGTLSFALYLVAVARDLRLVDKLRQKLR